VYFYYREHLPPHFHAIYAGSEPQVAIDDLSTLSGRLPQRAMAMVVEWASQHRHELRRNWQRVVAHEPPQPIEPLR
jgi:hypothetical protein